jgi:hypothetical protein
LFKRSYGAIKKSAASAALYTEFNGTKPHAGDLRQNAGSVFTFHTG